MLKWLQRRLCRHVCSQRQMHREGEKVKVLTEGIHKKAGVNPRPSTPKQEIRPPPQKPQKPPDPPPNGSDGMVCATCLKCGAVLRAEYGLALPCDWVR